MSIFNVLVLLLYACLLVACFYFTPSRGAAEQALGARILMHDESVGAIRSTLTGVVIFYAFILYPYKKIGKLTYASLQ